MGANTDEAVPPHNLEIERAVLGCILLEHRLARGVELLTPNDFYKDGHRMVFQAILALVGRNEPVDLLTVREELSRRGDLDLAGGPAALAMLTEEATTSTNSVIYARYVREYSLRRELTSRFGQAAAKLFEPEADIGWLLERMGTHIADARDSFLSLKGQVEKETNFQPVKAADILAREVEPISWVWDRFIPEGRLVLLSAFMKVGKSSWANALAVSVAQGHPFLGFSTRQGGVLILAVEEHPNDVNRRLHRFGMRNDDEIYVHTGSLDSTPETLNMIRAFVTKHRIRLLDARQKRQGCAREK